MYRPPEITGSFAVNNTDVVYLFLETGFDVIGYKTAQITRAKGVQIKRAVDR